MKVLVIGNGSREHAITWKLSQSELVNELFVAPGNAGTAQIAQNIPISATDLPGLRNYVQDNSVDFTVVGPEAPLAEGIVDYFQEADLLIFGPTESAAQIESSKVFSKELMLANGIPTGMAESFYSFGEASEYVLGQTAPVVIKADGLAAGKGVVIAQSQEDAVVALREAMEEKKFGASGDNVLVEEFLEGKEVSVFAFVDGKYVSPMVAACDYKRVGDGDVGPNTGGMGSYSPPSPDHWNDEIASQVREEIMEPIAKALAEAGSPYQGVLYLGMILTESGPKVIEFNCRLGDPEAQVLIPLLKSDLAEIMLATAQGKLQGFDIQWSDQSAVGVAVASGGYPDSYETGFPISGLEDLSDELIVFHAGTKLVGEENSEVVTDGGRVLTVTAVADSVEDARRIVYDNLDDISFRGSFYRTDIAKNI